MSRKAWSALAGAVMVVSVGVASAHTGEAIKVITDDGTFPAIDDGRLNAFDIGAPVVVYYSTQEIPQEDGTMLDVANGIDLLAVNQETNTGDPVLHASLEDIQKLLDGSESSFSANGYSLRYKHESGWFWLSTPADSEGKTYTFAWENTVFQTA